jgi:tetratricopeptide (TPR) repeat protein
VLTDAFEIQRDRGNVIGMSWVMQVRSRLELATGAFAESLNRAKQALMFAERVGVAEYINAARFAMARAYWAMGSYGTATDLFQALYNTADTLNSHAELCMALNGMADCALAVADVIRAEDHVYIAGQLAPAMDDLNLTAAARLLAAEIQLMRGMAEDARQNLVATLTYFLNEDIQRGTHVWDDGNRQEAVMRAWTLQAEAERMLGHNHAARESLMQALELSSKVGAIPYQLRALVAASELIAQSDPERASALAATVMQDTRAFAADRARASSLLTGLPRATALYQTLDSAILAFYRG